MRLRYLYLPDMPPLKDMRIEFGRGAPLLIERTCAIRFVVGVNGTGKSRLMQALAEIMLTLEAPRLPRFNFALAYDLGKNAAARTIFICHLGSSPASALLVEFAGLADEDTDWLTLETLRWDDERQTWSVPLPTIRYQREDSGKLDARRAEDAVRAYFHGNNLPSMRGGYLPNIVLAYTSGDLQGWELVFRSAGRSETIESTPQAERPRGWTLADDLVEQQRVRNEQIISALRRGEMELAQRLLHEETSPSELRVDPTETLGTLITPQKLKLAVCAVTLHQALRDFRAMPDEASEEVFIEQIEQQPDELRRILNQVDWLWPVSISLRVDMHRDRLRAQRCFILRQLYSFEYPAPSQAADVTGEELIKMKRAPRVTTVVRDPEGSEGRLLVYDLRRTLQEYPAPDEEKNTLGALIEAITGRRDATAFELFSQLSQWHDDGLLEDVFLAVRKRYTEDLLLYDWLSDGERVFLGRMALFHLLQGMGDALVLLDEPETHFNDIWKREIVSLIDAAIGDEPSDVVISTHSSITLSDVANEEIELLYRDDGHTVAGSIRSPTFGTDPSEIMVNIFGAEDSIGRRSLDRLDALLAREWTIGDLDWLERVIRQIGPGYHRSELRTVLRRLRASQS